MLRDILLVFVGSGIGGAMRYLSTIMCRSFLPQSYLFISTLSVNILGSFLIGVLLCSFANIEEINHPVKLLLTIGFCGGFTTFSTFSAESIALFQSGQYMLFLIYIIGSVVLSLLAMAGGYYLFN